MTKKKNKFLTFCFSMLPGAAEMYMGFMKMGISLMGIFFGIIAITAILEISELAFAIAVIWFYGFFHAHNLRGLDDEDFYQIEDDYLFHISKLSDNQYEFIKSYHKTIAWVLIAFGVVLIWKSFMSVILYNIPYPFDSFFYSLNSFLPRLVVGIGIIAIGIILIRSKKKELDEEEKNGENIGIEDKSEQ